MHLPPKNFSLSSRSVQSRRPRPAMCYRGLAGEPRLVDRADGDPCPAAGRERGRAERGRLALGRHLDRNPEQVGLELHQEPVRGRAAVGAEHARARSGSASTHVGDLVRDRLERGAHEVRAASCRA